MADLKKWLESTQLAHLLPVLSAHAIDIDVLADLTDIELREIGIPLGDRKRLLRAVASLKGGVEPAEVSSDRRHVTVMFCDFVGSTALSFELDPEDYQEVIREHHARVARLVKKRGGHVAELMGDGTLVYFGWPSASETDAERAILAALDVLEEGTSGRGKKVSLRIGIATGLVVVGSTSLDHTVSGQSARGTAPNFAARIQALADPNTILVDGATRMAVGSLFDFEALGTVELKGIPGPTQVWKVLSKKNAADRFRALRSETSTALIGRDEELDYLRARWSKACSGQGSTVVLVGEPGIGKSRLLAELEALTDPASRSLIRLFCSPHSTESAFFPAVQHIASAACFSPSDSEADRIEKLRRWLDWGSETELAALGEMMSLATGDPLEAMTSMRRRQITFEALERVLVRSSEHRPTLLEFEDAHWVDPSTRDLLGMLVRDVGKYHLLVVITCRPEFEVPWIGSAGVSVLHLNRLDLKQTADFLAQLMSSGLGDPHLSMEIAERSDGVPLFIEELARAAAEGAREQPFERRARVPQSLQAALMARLDRYPAAKMAAQVASVLGREFSYEAVRAMNALPSETLDDELGDLTRSGLVYQFGSPPFARYTFRHSLVRDAAYESVLNDKKVELHRSAVIALTYSDPGLTQTRPEILALHAAEGLLFDEAAGYYLQAGQSAANRSAMAEAKVHLQRGLDVAAGAKPGIARDVLEAELHVVLGTVEMAVSGFASERATGSFQRAIDLCNTLPSTGTPRTRLMAHAFFGVWSFKLHAGELRGAREVATAFCSMAKEQDRPDILMMARAIAGTNDFYLGDFEAARSQLAEAIEMMADLRSRDGPPEFGIDMECLLRTHYSCVLACTGDSHAAAAHTEAAISRVKELHHLPSLALTLATAADVFWLLRATERLALILPSLIAMTKEQGFPFWLARAKCFLGWCEAQNGHLDQGELLICEGLAELQSQRILLYQPLFLAMLAEIYELMGDPARASSALQRGIRLVSSTQEKWCAKELLSRPNRPEALAAAKARCLKLGNP
jgi:class 3 adenylate cyclase